MLNSKNYTNIDIEELISDLKNNYYLDAIKVDLASEPINDVELIKISQLANKYNLNLVFKIGGCDAIHDMYLARIYSANGILIPMIETNYSLVKSIDNLSQIYSNVNDIDLYINIETSIGVVNFDSIFNIPESKFVKRVVLGRDDLVKSCGFNIDVINSEKIFKITNEISNKVFSLDKEFAIGGKILPNAKLFLEKIQFDKLNYIETRKVIFNKEIINSNFYDIGILKALLLEYLYLSQSSLKNSIISQRIKSLKDLLYSYE